MNKASFICLILTISLYLLFRKIHQRHRKPWLMPVIAVPAIILTYLLFFKISFNDYYRYNHWLTWLLGPTIISFAIPLFENKQIIKQHIFSITAGVIIGVTVSIGSSFLLVHFLQFPIEIQKSFIFRSVSTPFAMEATSRIGGDPNLAAIFVVCTGVSGYLAGVFWINLVRIRSYMAQGAALGASAHGIATAKAFEIGSKHGVISSLVMMLSGMLTLLLAPLIGRLF